MLQIVKRGLHLLNSCVKMQITRRKWSDFYSLAQKTFYSERGALLDGSCNKGCCPGQTQQHIQLPLRPEAGEKSDMAEPVYLYDGYTGACVHGALQVYAHVLSACVFL